MKRIMITLLLVVFVLFAASAGGNHSLAEDGELLNNGFEADSAEFCVGEGGQVFDAVKSLQTSVVHTGRQALQIDSPNGDGWNLGMPGYEVQLGEVYEIDLWIKTSSDVHTWLVFGTWSGNEIVNLMAGHVPISPTSEWKHVVARVSAAQGITHISPRLGAWGKGTVWIDDVKLRRIARKDIAAMPPEVTISNEWLDVRFATEVMTLTVVDKRTGKSWSPANLDNELMLVDVHASERVLQATMYKADSDLTLQVEAALSESAPTLSVTLSGQGDMNRQIVFPKPFRASASSKIVIPQQEGVLFPSADMDLPEGNFQTSGRMKFTRISWNRSMPATWTKEASRVLGRKTLSSIRMVPIRLAGKYRSTGTMSLRIDTSLQTCFVSRSMRSIISHGRRRS